MDGVGWVPLLRRRRGETPSPDPAARALLRERCPYGGPASAGL